MKTWNRALFCTTAIGILGAAYAAMAADPAAPASADAGASGSQQEVVVTAERRAERLEDVPASVTVVTPQALKNSGVNNIMDISHVTNGVQFNFSGSVPGIAVRGVSSVIAGYSIEPNVAIYIDGFYDPQPLTIASDIANLESLEVLKGPQGALYGRNATGGAILFNTLGPSRTFKGNFDASYGAYNDVTLNGYVAGPINDRVRYGVSAHYQHGDCTMRKASPTVIGATVGPACTFEEAAFRGKLQADLTDNLEATLGLNISYHSDPRENLFSAFGHNAVLPPPPITITKFGTEAYVGQQPRDYAYQDEGTLKLAYKTSIGTLTSYTGFAYRRFGLDVKFDGSYVTGATFGFPAGSPEFNAPFLISAIRYDQKTFQEAVDYNITAINHVDLDVGGIYYSDDFRTIPGEGGPVNLQFNDFQTAAHTYQHSRSWAIFADGTYHVTDKLSLNVGGRFSSDYREDEYDVTGVFSLTCPTAPICTPVTLNHHTWTAFTPKATIRYELMPRTDVYFSYSQGYREGTYNTAGPQCSGVGPVGPNNKCVFNPDPPETITSYEAGFKAELAMFHFTTAVFHYDWKNLQLVLVGQNPFNANQLTSVLGVAPSATVNGWESELDVTPTEHLTLHAAITLLDAKYGKFPNAAGEGLCGIVAGCPQPGGAPNIPFNTNISGQTQNWTGVQLPRSPKYSGHVGFDYDQPLSYGSLFFTTNLFFTDSYVVSNPSIYGPLAQPALRNKQRFVQSPYALLSAQLSWTDPTKRYTITVYGDNLTNASYRLSYDGGPFGDFTDKADPITGGVKFGYKF